jgi:hypothetical protein
MRMLAFVLLGAACGGGNGQSSSPVDAAPSSTVDAGTGGGVDSGLPTCLTAAQRTMECTADVSMRIVDFTTLLPVAADVGITTAWDVAPPFPASCSDLASVMVGADGLLVAPQAPCQSSLGRPVLLLKITGGTTVLYASTAWDQRLDCAGGLPCGMARGDIAVPKRVLSSAWRGELAAGGMARAETRGLVIFLYKESDGSPAAGVRATRGLGTFMPLATGTEVRYIADDRQALLPRTAETTGASGMAIIGLDFSSANVGGTRGAEEWASLGVLFADGWFFLEDRTRTK